MTGAELIEYDVVVYVQRCSQMCAFYFSIVPFPQRYIGMNAVTGESLSFKRDNVRVRLHNHYRSEGGLKALGMTTLKEIAAIVFEARGTENEYPNTPTGRRLGLKKRSSDDE